MQKKNQIVTLEQLGYTVISGVCFNDEVDEILSCLESATYLGIASTRTKEVLRSGNCFMRVLN